MRKVIYKMKAYVALFAVTTAISVAFVSCDKSSKEEEKDKFQEGIVLDYGEPALDGCGWMIKVKDVVHALSTTLPSEFRQDSLKVYVKYSILSQTSHCAWAETDRPSIEILDIKTR
jgi:hypothetical protein